MGWSTTDWTPGNIQRYADEFWEALNERIFASSFTYIPYLAGEVNLPVPGANIQKATYYGPMSTTGVYSFKCLQLMVKSLCNYFARSHDVAGQLYDKDHYIGVSVGLGDSGITWSFSDLLTSIRGSAQTHFRRASEWPDDWEDWSDPAYSTGYASTGDILGPWILYDLQQSLNRLIWSVSWSTAIKDYRQYSGNGISAAAAQADYALRSSGPSSHVDFYQYGRKTPWYYLQTRVGKIAGFVPYKSGISRQIDILVRSQAFWQQEWAAFDAKDGDGNVLQEDKISLFQRYEPGPASQNIVSTNDLGSNNAASSFSSSEEYKGWRVVNQSDAEALFLTRWNIPGGFDYY